LLELDWSVDTAAYNGASKRRIASIDVIDKSPLLFIFSSGAREQFVFVLVKTYSSTRELEPIQRLFSGSRHARGWLDEPEVVLRLLLPNQELSESVEPRCDSLHDSSL
jgi:hypothetical protein